jgi:hypothetical protein
MIFHGVYTTPQFIDSTLSTESNYAVNGKAVADYVSAKILSEITDENDTTNIPSPKAIVDYVEGKAGGGGGETITLPTDYIAITGVNALIQQPVIVSFGNVVSVSFLIFFSEDIRLTNIEDARQFAILTENAPKAKNLAIGTMLGTMTTTSPAIQFILFTSGDFYFQPQSTTISNSSSWWASITYISE